MNNILTKLRINRIVVLSFLAVIAGFIVGGIIMLIFGYSPTENYLNLFRGSFGDIYSFGETLRNATPLILTALGFSVASKAGMFNVGGSGQLLLGWMGAITFALKFSFLPGPVLIIGSILTGAIFGAVYSGIAGLLKAYFGTSEVITTIMMNYVAFYFVNFAVKKYLAEHNSDASPNILPKASLRSPMLEGLTNNSTFHWGFVIALVMAFLMYLYLNKMKQGFEIKSVGINEEAARYSGISTKKVIIISMLLSGLLAGIGGAVDGLGNYQNISVSTVLPDIGFNGMAVSLLANQNPIGIIFASILFSSLQVGGLSISVYSDTPPEIVNIVISSIIFFVGVKYLFEFILKRKETN
ncbi:ABC transporter permease [Companilactobacillus sp. RD055328]|uniref:ABC transporter permease n=1 Tax=Companilactobacillus sp. RD055328 TaxID=2916634 RepID=UPI001FC820A7|nr:ABC transporter permease [Companilactobacillus sp. RD055328]GKQ43273.1 ABC transporter permease [Companilactobacillus sp. RD055328]